MLKDKKCKNLIYFIVYLNISFYLYMTLLGRTSGKFEDILFKILFILLIGYSIYLYNSYDGALIEKSRITCELNEKIKWLEDSKDFDKKNIKYYTENSEKLYKRIEELEKQLKEKE